MNTPWYLLREVLTAMPSPHARAILLYIGASGAVRSTISDLSELFGCTRRTVSSSLNFLSENGFIVVSGQGYAREYALSSQIPICAQGTHLCAQRAHICAQRAQIEEIGSKSAEIREGDTLLGGSKSKSLKVLSHTTTVGASFPSPTEVTASSAGEMRLSAIAEIRSYEGEFFSLFGRLVSADELDLLAEQWQAARKYAGRFPNRTEVTDAISWLKSKPYPKTPKAFITAMGAIKEVRDGSGQESTRPVGGTGRTPGVPTDKARERLARWMAEAPDAKRIAEENAAVAAGNW